MRRGQGIEYLYEGGGAPTPATHGSKCKPIGEGEEIEYLYEGGGEEQPHLFLIGVNADLMGRMKVTEYLEMRWEGKDRRSHLV